MKTNSWANIETKFSSRNFLEVNYNFDQVAISNRLSNIGILDRKVFEKQYKSTIPWLMKMIASTKEFRSNLNFISTLVGNNMVNIL